MRNRRRRPLGLGLGVGLLLAGAGLSATGSAQTPVPTGEDVDRSLQEVRALIRAGEHEAAIGAAKTAQAAVEAVPSDSARVAQAYLLVALSYVNYANFQANERRPMAAETLYKEARSAIEAGLSIPALRHLQLDRTSGEYPPEMIEMFERVRSEMFGALRIIAREPHDAVVALDGVPLGALAGEPFLGDTAVPVGPHAITVTRTGYRSQQETITVTPNSWQERPYKLLKKRGRKFYAVVGTGVAAVAGGVAALVAGSGASGDTPLEPLPGPPPPPGH